MASLPAASLNQKPRRKAFLSPRILAVVVGLHLLFAALAAVWVVARVHATRQLTFRAGPKSPNPSERVLEHRVQLQKKARSLSAPPSVPRRILAQGAASISLPPLPDLPLSASAPPTMMSAGGTSAAFVSSRANSLGGAVGGGGNPINFFGIRDLSRSVVIMIDVSDSMFTRTGDAAGRKLRKHGKEQNFQAVRDEAIQLVQSLTAQTSFGIVCWAGGAYSWKPQLLPATAENKADASSYIQREVDYKTAPAKKGERGGTRHDLALAAAFALKPQTIYLITDGNATISQPHGGLRAIPAQEIYRVAEAGQQSLSEKAHLHVIYYVNAREKPDEIAMLRGLASRNGGKFEKVKARGGKN